MFALESAVLKKLELMLECRTAEEELMEFLEVEDWSLGVVGMSAGPEDDIQLNNMFYIFLGNCAVVVV